MTGKNLKKLGRKELIRMMYGMHNEQKRMQEDIALLRKSLDDRRIRIEKAGSIAAAAADINRLFEAAQATADQYLDSVQVMKAESDEKIRHTVKRCENAVAQAEGKAEAIIRDAEEKRNAILKAAEQHGSSVIQDAKKRSSEIMQNVMRQRAAILQDARKQCDAMLREAEREIDRKWNAVYYSESNMMRTASAQNRSTFRAQN